MAPKLKSRRYKKRRVVSSKKRRQPKSRTKRYRRKTRKTRKTRGGMKRSVPSTPTQEYGEYNGEPLAPRKNRTRAVDDAVVGFNLFEGFPGNEGYQEGQEDQENINPQTQENNLFAVTPPRGNLNNAIDEAYMESITTPQDRIVRGLDYTEATISPLPAYREVNPNDDINNDDDDDELTDDEFYGDLPNNVEEGYQTQPDSDEEL